MIIAKSPRRGNTKEMKNTQRRNYERLSNLQRVVECGIAVNII